MIGFRAIAVFKPFIAPLNEKVLVAALSCAAENPRVVSICSRSVSTTPIPAKINFLFSCFKPFVDKMSFNCLSDNPLQAAPIVSRFSSSSPFLNKAIAAPNCAVLLAAAINPVPIETTAFAAPIATSPASVPFKRFVLSKNATSPVVACIILLYSSSVIMLVDKDSIAAVSSFVFASIEFWYIP